DKTLPKTTLAPSQGKPLGRVNLETAIERCLLRSVLNLVRAFQAGEMKMGAALGTTTALASTPNRASTTMIATIFIGPVLKTAESFIDISGVGVFQETPLFTT